MYTSITNRGKSVKDKMIENYYILNQIVQSIDTGILIIFDGKLLHVNNETRRISQRTYRDIERNVLDCVAPSCRMEAVRAYFSVLHCQVDRLEVFMDILLPSGAPKAVRCRFSRIRINESDGIFITVHDISDNTLQQHFSSPLTMLCHRYMNDYQAVFSKPYDFFALLDEFYVITNLGLKFEQLTGYRRADYVGRRIDSIPGISPYVEISQALQNSKEASTGKVPRNLRISLRNSKGHAVIFDIVITMVNFRGVRQRLCVLFRLVGEQQPQPQENKPSPDAAPMAHAAADPAHDFSGKKVIVAEDSEINCLLLKKILERTGISILWAHNGVECVELFDKNRDASVILMDMQMPVMDGFEAAGRILKIDGTVPIIAQTAYGFDDDRKRIMEIGCADFVSKPIDRALLLDSIASVIR
ncbi:MAG: response regulator [Bacteroidales bacterium]|nr:response regulator [Bacteroidales bacterium]